MPIKLLLKRFCRGDNGAIAVLFALFIVVFIGAMAISIDVGSWYLAQRKLQTEADLAAVSAALSLEPSATDPAAKSRAAAERTVVGNGLRATAVTDVEPKTFAFDTSVPIDERLKELGPGDLPNAVTAELRQNTPVYFASLFLPQDHLSLRAEASATKVDFAAFTLGSRLAQLRDTGALNHLLKAALGSGVTLQLLDYNALLGAEVNLLEFSDALATQVNLQAANYTDLMDASITTPQLINAIIASLPKTTDGQNAATALSNMISRVARDTLTIRQLLSIEDGITDLHVNDILEPIHVSALDILMASVDILNAKNHRIVEFPLSLSIPGVAEVDVELLVGERKVGTGWVTIGGVGATLHTAQVRMKVDIVIGVAIGNAVKSEVNQSALLSVSINLPIYIEVASATVTLIALNCQALADSDVFARFKTGNTPFDVTEGDWPANSKYIKSYRPNGGAPYQGTAIAGIYIGEFPNDVFKNTTQALSPKDLQAGVLLNANVQRLLGIQLLEFKIRGAIRLGESRQAEISFLKSEVPTLGNGRPPTEKTIGSSVALGSLVSQLLNKNNLEITQSAPGLIGAILGVVLTVLNLLSDIVPNNLIELLLTPVDALIDNVLDLLGLGIGEMDLALHGVSCGNVTLVR